MDNSQDNSQDQDLETRNQDPEKRYHGLLQRRGTIHNLKLQVEAELAARKRELSKLYKEAIDNGFNPDNLREEIRRKEQVFVLKMDSYEADLTAAEQALKPMIQEIQSGHG